MKKDECKEQSRVTRWMHNLKENNPEKYAEVLEKKRIRDARYRENHPGRTSKWRHGLKETDPKKYAEVNAKRRVLVKICKKKSAKVLRMNKQARKVVDCLGSM